MKISSFGKKIEYCSCPTNPSGIQQNSDDLSHCFQVVFHECGWVPDGHDIAMNQNISPDRKEVTYSIGGQCAKCTPQNETILLNAEGKSYSIYFFKLTYFYRFFDKNISKL